ncbi:MAG: DoxX family protein [Paenibacillus sp.]|jgi:hypothetical protein|nr:DoxX family protein [Paenibacillus sp.]
MELNIALWIVQGITALGYLYSGWLKAIQVDKAAQSWKWVNSMPKELVMLIGWIELIGAVGMIVPQATGIAPILTPVAAIGLAVVVVLGALLHMKRGEFRELGVNAVFLALALIVAIGRW